jgi:hypothetical protein
MDDVEKRKFLTVPGLELRLRLPDRSQSLSLHLLYRISADALCKETAHETIAAFQLTPVLICVTTPVLVTSLMSIAVLLALKNGPLCDDDND